jgi:hypothetical protein
VLLESRLRSGSDWQGGLISSDGILDPNSAKIGSMLPTFLVCGCLKHCEANAVVRVRRSISRH